MAMTPQQKEEYKKQMAMLGYMYGKQMAALKKKKSGEQNKSSEPIKSTPSNGELTIKFKKGGNIITVKKKGDDMVSDLIFDYCQKANVNNGTFTFNGRKLSPEDCTTLNENGITDGSQIIVS